MTVVRLPGNKTPQQIGRDFEVEWAARRGLSPQPMSGAGVAYKLDVGGRGILASLKHTLHASFSVTSDLVREMVSGARGPAGREAMPVFVVKMDGVDEPVWVMLESDAIAVLEGTSGVGLRPSKLAEKRAAADPDSWAEEYVVDQRREPIARVEVDG